MFQFEVGRGLVLLWRQPTWIGETWNGRRIRARAQHTALNALLQSCEAIIAKLWAVHAVAELRGQAKLLLHVHDETQWECASADVEDMARTVVWAAAEAGRCLKLQIPLDTEAKVGRDWSETH